MNKLPVPVIDCPTAAVPVRMTPSVNFNMAVDTGAAANHAMATNFRTAGNAHTTGNGRMIANFHIMADLHQIIYFNSLTDHGILQGSAINGGISADFNIIADDYPAYLRDFHPLPAIMRQTKSICADHCATMDNHPISQ